MSILNKLIPITSECQSKSILGIFYLSKLSRGNKQAKCMSWRSESFIGNTTPPKILQVLCVRANP
ncbi:hypothetical protein SAMN02745166_02754 [Prosthecobacter debontii]|uniref:Uncharacterized protein n=1 Tax=Prosthecobacter debontii TaxID=48467 RepID=A0A1T4YA75_9BACT|nr:hypothetical protein SAMN02745166_02754 [Prosthecobacter debontii]